MLVDGKLDPCWCDNEILPATSADVLFESVEEKNSSAEDDEASMEEESEGWSSDSEDDDRALNALNSLAGA